jgi:hypothetical protein
MCKAIKSTLQMLTQFLILHWLKQMSNIQIGMIHTRNIKNGILIEVESAHSVKLNFVCQPVK